jgi:hypothetical protein
MVADHDHVYAEVSGRLEARRPAREGNKRPGRREVTSIDPHGEFFHT